MAEYTDKDMVKSLVKIIESLTRQNEELRKEIEGLRAILVMRFNSASLGLSSVTDRKCE